MIFTSSIQFRLRTLFYICRLRYPAYPNYCFPTYMFYIYMKIRKQNSYCCVVPCPSDLIEFYLKDHTDSSFDENNCVIIPENQVKNVINNRFNLVKIHLKNNDEDYRIVHVIPLSNLNSDEYLMSDVLFYNINQLNYVNKMQLSPISHHCVKIAKDVEIVIINTQHEINNGVIDMLLKNYFQTPRILYKYDTFSINIAKYAPDFVCSNFQLTDIDNLYFKCKKISTHTLDDSLSGCFCVKGESTLKQTANIRGYLPASIFNLCDKKVLRRNVKYEQCITSKCPRGLEEFMQKIEKAVQPFLPKNNLSLDPAFLIQGNKGVGKNAIIEALAAKLGLHVYKVECSDVQTSTHAQTENKLRNVFMKSKLTAPCFLILNNFEIYGKDNEGNYDARLINFFQSELEALFEGNNFPIILICLSNSRNISSALSRSFLETFKIEAPTQAQRTSLLRWLVRSKNLSSDVDLDTVGAKTHGFMLGDLDALVYHSMKMCCVDRGEKRPEIICLRKTDFEKALDLMQKSYTSSIGAPKVPKVQWSDVGGLHALKREIMRTINLPLQHPNLLKITGLKRSGILLFGPPGTGKTLIAKAVATECGLCFLSVKGPELLNMYVGQSEQNVRQVFEKAREASPCIIFFDELDSLAPNRGISGDSGGVMDRVVSQLLSEMDGLNEEGTVFIIGATNRPDLLDPALLRPGRFDKLLYVGPCADTLSKVGVLEALTRKFSLETDVKLDEIGKLCPNLLTGADLYSICANAWFTAVRRTITNIEAGRTENLNSPNVLVSMKDFATALGELKSSISEEDIKYFNMLRESNSEDNANKQNHVEIAVDKQQSYKRKPVNKIKK